jgi:hypothetical protein
METFLFSQGNALSGLQFLKEPRFSAATFELNNPNRIGAGVPVVVQCMPEAALVLNLRQRIYINLPAGCKDNK